MSDSPVGPNLSGLCLCGCGQKTRLAAQNSAERGWVKGEPVSYIRGHAPREINHVLTDIDPETRTATCSRCGPTGVKKNGGGVWKCLRGTPAKYNGTHALSDIDQDTRTAICRVCGSVQIVSKSRGKWLCATKTRQDGAIYRERHPEKVAAAQKVWHDANRDHVRRYHLLQKYEITPEDYDRMLAEQDGTCAICDGPPAGRGKGNSIFHVDHDHATGTVRGLLCAPCNTALGLFQDSPGTLLRAIEYLS